MAEHKLSKTTTIKMLDIIEDYAAKMTKVVEGDNNIPTDVLAQLLYNGVATAKLSVLVTERGTLLDG